MTVKELIEELVALVEYGDGDLPVYVYDIADGEGFPIDIVDPTISDRIDLNFDSSLL